MVRQEQLIFVNQECESVKPGGDGIRQIVDIHQVRLGDTKKKKKKSIVKTTECVCSISL